MNKNFTLLSAIVFLVSPVTAMSAPGRTTAQAQSRPQAETVEEFSSRFEVSALTNGTLFFNGDGSLGYIAGGISYLLVPGLQLSLTAGYARVSADKTTIWALGALVGPVINFPFTSDVRNALFGSVKYGGGILGTEFAGTTSTRSNSDSKGMVDATLGKRFQLSDRISWTPELGVSKVLGDNGGKAVFRFVPVGLSLFF